MVWVLASCGVKATDLGDLPTSSDSGSESGSGSESASTDPVDCVAEGEACENGCCAGFGCDFSGMCVACTPAGEELDIDGAGCCDGLVAGPTLVCYEPVCTEDGCPDDVAGCAMLSAAVHTDGEQFARDCAPEACLGSRELLLANAAGSPGLECVGGGGSDACAAEADQPQVYAFESDALRLTLAFDAAVLDDYSTASFNDHFKSAAGQLEIPDASVPLVAFVESGTVSAMTYADGRLQFTITVPLDDTHVTIESDAEDCLSDDIAGMCACYYDDLGTFDVVVDLEIESP